MQSRNILWVMIIFTVVCCRQAYVPPSIVLPNNFLVVDGVINAGSDSTVLKITRSRNLGVDTGFIHETGATLSVNGKLGDVHPLRESGAGTYVAAALNLSAGEDYQLKITTAAGKIYLSDFVPVLQTPAIDSISWQQRKDGIIIFANTHDPTNSNAYYRWDFEETWEYHSTYLTDLIYRGGQVVDRDSTEYTYSCWHTRPSATILIGNASGLSQHIIYHAPLNLIPEGDVRLSLQYSLLLRQYAITQDAFIFWQNLAKNTENRGSLFDAQPSEAIGNIRCLTDPSEPVVGYISINTVAQARIFISRPQSPPWPYKTTPCDTLKVALAPDSLALYFNRDYYIPVAKHFAGPALIGYFAFPSACVDCRLDGGENTKPTFWP